MAWKKLFGPKESDIASEEEVKSKAEIDEAVAAIEAAEKEDTLIAVVRGNTVRDVVLGGLDPDADAARDEDIEST